MEKSKNNWFKCKKNRRAGVIPDLRLVSDMPDDDLAEAGIAVKLHCPGGGTARNTFFQHFGERGGSVNFRAVFLGNQYDQLTERTFQIHGAVFRHFVTGTQIQGQLTESHFRSAAGQPGKLNGVMVFSETGFTGEDFSGAAAVAVLEFMSVADKREAALFGTVQGIEMKPDAEQDQGFEGADILLGIPKIVHVIIIGFAAGTGTIKAIRC